MWSSDRSPRRIPFLPGAALLLALFVLGACGGFRPLYEARKDTAASAALELAQTGIHPIADRFGQQLHNHLLDLINPRGRPASPRYGLSVTLTSSTANTAISKSAYATRASLNASATFTLTDVTTGKALLNGTRRVVTGYNILDSEYATLVSEKDAEARAARELAHGIQNQIAVFFRQRAEQGTTP